MLLLPTTMIDREERIDPSEMTLDQSDSSNSFSFSLYVSLVTKELNRVHNTMQEPYDFSLPTEHERWLVNCNEVYEELCAWRSTTLPSPFATYGFDVEGRVKLGANAVAANIALDRYALFYFRSDSTLTHKQCPNCNVSETSTWWAEFQESLGPLSSCLQQHRCHCRHHCR